MELGGAYDCESTPDTALTGERESSGFINDLHVWFRSFRVKLSRVIIVARHAQEVSLGFRVFFSEIQLSSTQRNRAGYLPARWLFTKVSCFFEVDGGR